MYGNVVGTASVSLDHVTAIADTDAGYGGLKSIAAIVAVGFDVNAATNCFGCSC